MPKKTTKQILPPYEEVKHEEKEEVKEEVKEEKEEEFSYKKELLNDLDELEENLELIKFMTDKIDFNNLNQLDAVEMLFDELLKNVRRGKNIRHRYLADLKMDSIKDKFPAGYEEEEKKAG